MASRSGATEVDLLAPPAWTTVDPSGHGLSDPSPCQRKTRPGDIAESTENWPRWASDLRLRVCGQSFAAMASSPRPDGRVRVGRSSYERRQRRCWHATSSPRHGAAPTRLRAVLHRDRQPSGLVFRSHRQPSRGPGHPASPQPEHRRLRALPSSQVPRPGQRHEVHRQLRRGVPH
jgi:hypothetical protein